MSKSEPKKSPAHGEREFASGILPLLNSQSIVPFRRGRHAGRKAEAQLPQRYEIRDSDDGRTLYCKEAPAVAVQLDRSYAFSEAEARRLGERVVMLDGAGQFAPLVDSTAQLYNFDHHRDCQRAFTLATCEQALVMVIKGLELDKGVWTLYANEPDLDTIFALWVLLNHRRVRNLDTRGRDALLPLLRLEGAIDANGNDVAEFCGLPRNLLRKTQAKLDGLFAKELAVKSGGEWETLDHYQYVIEMLSEIDQLIYRLEDFSDFVSVDKELGHVEIGQDRVAVLVSDATGIYEVEKRLKKFWGERLGIVALAKDQRHWTLRRTASFAGIDLDLAYAKLNLLDRSVDGRPAEKRWGGSDEIGGSPRPVGTALSAGEIAKILRLAYRQPPRWLGLQHVAMAALWTVLLGLLSWVLVLGLRFLPQLQTEVLRPTTELTVLGGVLALAAILFTFGLARQRTYIFGWRRPAGWDGLLLLPAVLLGAAMGGAWAIPMAEHGLASPLLASVAIGVGVLGREFWFRGVVHGRLLLDAPVMSVGGPWLLSRASAVSAVLGALFCLGLTAVPLAEAPVSTVGWLRPFLPALGALFAGLGLGMMRERSLSVWPGVLAQLLGVGAWLICRLLLLG